MLARDGEDHRQLPLSLRKTNLARLLMRRIPGIFIAEYEQGDIGRDLFRVVCDMGLEGIVSKRRDRAYTPGKCEHWMKTKNPAHPAYSRVRDQLLAIPKISRQAQSCPPLLIRRTRPCSRISIIR